jgi:hypothetical protein
VCCLRLDGSLEIPVQYVWIEVVAVGPDDCAELWIDPDLTIP